MPKIFFVKTYILKSLYKKKKKKKKSRSTLKRATTHKLRKADLSIKHLLGLFSYLRWCCFCKAASDIWPCRICFLCLSTSPSIRAKAWFPTWPRSDSRLSCSQSSAQTNKATVHISTAEPSWKLGFQSWWGLHSPLVRAADRLQVQTRAATEDTAHQNFGKSSLTASGVSQ